MKSRQFSDDLLDHQLTIESLVALAPVVAGAVELLASALRSGGKILVCGNGGSAADAQHFAAEMTGRFEQDRAPLAAIALSTDSSALTAIGNDYGFDQVFARQVRAIGRPGDCLIAISTSGNSPNVLEAVREARAIGFHSIALTGRGGGELATQCEPAIVVPSVSTARIQEAHIFLIHALCAGIERSLGMEVHS
jgi:D-sedoheptulose 7-phosphate isomerase